MNTVIHPAAQHGFSQSADVYQHARPDYPQAIVEWMQHDLALGAQSQLADLGSGTGKLIPFLQQVSQKITAIEPISEMLQQLQNRFPAVATKQTDSQNLSFPSEYFDALFCAQSFHWFADSASLDEIYQVLKPHGILGLIWNQRDTTVPWVKAIADLLAPLEGDTPRYHKGDWQQVLDNHHEQFALVSQQTFAFAHVGTVEQVVIQRILSTSFIAASSVADKAIMRQSLEKLMKNQLGLNPSDEIAFPYVTHAYHYQKT